MNKELNRSCFKEGLRLW